MTTQVLRSSGQKDIQALEWSAAQNAERSSLSRTDIEFCNVAPNRVAIEIKLRNDGDRPTPGQIVTLQAAPLGAFVPWAPLTTLPLPPLAPGEVRYLRTSAVVAPPPALGSPDRVPPRRLLTALGMDDEPSDDVPMARTALRQAPGGRALPPDLMAMLLREVPHWVGNLNILMADKDVERHVARELRVSPGRMNMAWFVVGFGGSDAYSFRLEGLAADWHAMLFDLTDRESLVLEPGESTGIAEDRWIATDGTRLLMLALRVPADCPSGAVEVHVCQKSSGRKAVVEFSLHPRAAGTGCYVV